MARKKNTPSPHKREFYSRYAHEARALQSALNKLTALVHMDWLFSLTVVDACNNVHTFSGGDMAKMMGRGGPRLVVKHPPFMDPEKILLHKERRQEVVRSLLPPGKENPCESAFYVSVGMLKALEAADGDATSIIDGDMTVRLDRRTAVWYPQEDAAASFFLTREAFSAQTMAPIPTPASMASAEDTLQLLDSLPAVPMGLLSDVSFAGRMDHAIEHIRGSIPSTDASSPMEREQPSGVYYRRGANPLKRPHCDDSVIVTQSSKFKRVRRETDQTLTTYRPPPLPAYAADTNWQPHGAAFTPQQPNSPDFAHIFDGFEQPTFSPSAGEDFAHSALSGIQSMLQEAFYSRPPAGSSVEYTVSMNSKISEEGRLDYFFMRRQRMAASTTSVESV